MRMYDDRFDNTYGFQNTENNYREEWEEYRRKMNEYERMWDEIKRKWEKDREEHEKQIKKDKVIIRVLQVASLIMLVMIILLSTLKVTSLHENTTSMILYHKFIQKTMFSKDTITKSLIEYKIAQLYEENKNHTEAINSYKKIISNLHDNPDYSSIIDTSYLRIGYNYFVMNRHKDGISFVDGLIAKYTEEKNYEKVSKISTEVGNMLLDTGQCSYIYPYAITAVKYGKKSKNKVFVGDGYLLLGNYYKCIGNVDEAKKYYTKAYNLYKKVGSEKQNIALFHIQNLYIQGPKPFYGEIVLTLKL